jgi:hypothetical protein
MPPIKKNAKKVTKTSPIIYEAHIADYKDAFNSRRKRSSSTGDNETSSNNNADSNKKARNSRRHSDSSHNIDDGNDDEESLNYTSGFTTSPSKSFF